jgi:hypothetical protein
MDMPHFTAEHQGSRNHSGYDRALPRDVDEFPATEMGSEAALA